MAGETVLIHAADGLYESRFFLWDNSYSEPRRFDVELNWRDNKYWAFEGKGDGKLSGYLEAGQVSLPNTPPRAAILVRKPSGGYPTILVKCP